MRDSSIPEFCCRDFVSDAGALGRSLQRISGKAVSVVSCGFRGSFRIDREVATQLPVDQLELLGIAAVIPLLVRYHDVEVVIAGRELREIEYVNATLPVAACLVGKLL